MPQQHFGRFYARSEKHLTDFLNEKVGQGRWMKTTRMIDVTGYDKVADRFEVPRWVRETRTLGNGRSHDVREPIVYRGILFKDAEAASLARMFVNAVDARDESDDVLVRSFHEVEITNEVRLRGLGRQGMAWESKAEAARRHEDAHKAIYPNSPYVP